MKSFYSTNIIKDFINDSTFTLLDNNDDQLTRARLILEPISEAYHKTLDNKEAVKAKKQLIHFYFGSATSDDDVGEQLKQNVYNFQIIFVSIFKIIYNTVLFVLHDLETHLDSNIKKHYVAQLTKNYSMQNNVLT